MTQVDTIAYDAYCVHGRGLAALLKIEDFPTGILAFLRDKKFLHLWSSMSSMNQADVALVRLVTELESISSRTRLALSDTSQVVSELSGLVEKTLTLDKKFQLWEQNQMNDLKPMVIGAVDARSGAAKDVPCFWPSKIDTYVDPYVAFVWNTYRAARLSLLQVLCNLSRVWHPENELKIEQSTVTRLVNDFTASIPYMLVEDIYAFLRDSGTTTSVTRAGRPGCGLLLMHPLHIVANISLVESNTRSYFNACLEFVGQRMGIGLASALAKVKPSSTFFKTGLTW